MPPYPECLQDLPSLLTRSSLHGHDNGLCMKITQFNAGVKNVRSVISINSVCLVAVRVLRHVKNFTFTVMCLLYGITLGYPTLS